MCCVRFTLIVGLLSLATSDLAMAGKSHRHGHGDHHGPTHHHVHDVYHHGHVHDGGYYINGGARIHKLLPRYHVVAPRHPRGYVPYARQYHGAVVYDYSACPHSHFDHYTGLHIDHVTLRIGW